MLTVVNTPFDTVKADLVSESSPFSADLLILSAYRRQEPQCPVCVPNRSRIGRPVSPTITSSGQADRSVCSSIQQCLLKGLANNDTSSRDRRLRRRHHDRDYGNVPIGYGKASASPAKSASRTGSSNRP